MRPKPEARMDNLDEQSLVSRRLTTVLGMEIPLHRYPHIGEAGIPYLGKNQRQARMEMSTALNASPTPTVRRATTACFDSMADGWRRLWPRRHGADEDAEGDEPAILPVVITGKHCHVPHVFLKSPFHVPRPSS
ncbi:hypothetical protein SEVIR_3G336366v4 [Setaria viridis]